MSKRRSLQAVLWMLLAGVALARSAGGAGMDKAHLKPGQFKIYDGHMSAEQKRCLAFALKQWVMYDEAPPADGHGNRNETNDDVSAAGARHEWDDTHGADAHSRSSRSLSADEKQDMKDAYGDSSPFHGPGQPVEDPTQPGSGWFTDDEGSADLTIEPTEQIQGKNVDPGTLGLADFRTFQDWDPQLRRRWWFKGRWDSLAAIIWMKNEPNGRSWCYPSDTNGDGWITNADTKCPPGTRDWYMIIKHELAHYFSFSHEGDPFMQEQVDPPPIYDGPISLCSTAMTHYNEQGVCEAEGSEFGSHARRLYFSSDRPGGYGGYDIWHAIWNDSLGVWVDPTNCGPNVNSPYDETDPFSAVGDAILYFASDRPGGLGLFDLYLIRRSGAESWDSLQTLPAGINTSADEMGPCETSDRLYFASNRPGGLGGFDLHVALLSDSTNMEWQAPVNLGPTINTAGNEIDPDVAFQNSDSLGVLYFASDRGGAPASGGGYDIYRALMNQGSWSPPTGLSAPLNTAFNETDPSVSLGDRFLYVAADRSDGHGGWDLFTARNLAPKLAVVWDHDGSGQPGQAVTVEFDVYNHGFSPFQCYPFAQNLEGWPMQYDPTPFPLEPGEGRPFAIEVTIPQEALPGSETRLEMWIQAQGTGQTFDSDHAYASVPAAGGVEVRPSPAAAGLALGGFPNPFRREVTLILRLPSSSDPRLEIFDAAGRRVRRLDPGPLASGTHRLSWDGRDDGGRGVSSGVYFARAQAGTERRSCTLLLAR